MGPEARGHVCCLADCSTATEEDNRGKLSKQMMGDNGAHLLPLFSAGFPNGVTAVVLLTALRTAIVAWLDGSIMRERGLAAHKVIWAAGAPECTACQ